MPMPLPDTAAIAGTVRAELARRNLRQDWLATFIGVSQSQVSKRLRGIVPFTTAELIAIADEFEMSLDALAHRAGSAA